jgi:hypothetical protein
MTVSPNRHVHDFESARSPIRMGALPSDMGRWSANAYLDVDSTLDAISFGSRLRCTRNHIFAKGPMAIPR